jgi:hypothetical protein
MGDIIAPEILKQIAVYWGPTGAADEHGQPLFDGPLEIKCRWIDTNEVYVTAGGENAMSAAKVLVDRDLVIGGLLRLGDLDSVMDVLVPQNNPGVFDIQKFDKIPDFKPTKFLRRAWL